MTLVHDRDFDPRHGEPVPVAPGIVRVTANNPGPFTFHGTNSYVVGTGPLAVVDPGPNDPDHIAALRAVIGGRRVTHILVTHTHQDHSPAARPLKTFTGAETVGAGRHRPSRPVRGEETPALEAAADLDFEPDIKVADGAAIDTPAGRFTAVATPGHTANHTAFALGGPAGILFSGDHVMAWSTTVVAPPDGSMADYMASLERLLARPQDRTYLPGHGGPVSDPQGYVAALKAHRQRREAAILERLETGEETIPEIVATLYRDVDPALHGAAAMSVLAHLEHLCARGTARADPSPSLAGRFRPASRG